MQEIPKKRQKILFVITKSNWGGAQRYVYDLATHLPALGFEVVVAHGGEGALVEKLKSHNVRTIKIECLTRDINIFREYKVLLSLLRLYKKECPDIVHLNSSKIGGLGSIAARLSHIKKIIFTAHGWAFKEKRNLFYLIFMYIASWLTAVFSHKVISVSYADMQSSLTFPLVKKKSRMVHNGIKAYEHLDKATSREFFKEKYAININDGKIIIATIAELHKNKGIAYAIEALALLKQKKHDFIYLIIGEGDEHTILESLIKKYNLADCVFLLGNIPDAQQYMSAFDIFILPSIKEGLPYVLLEAGLLKIATVASNVGGVPEVISHGTSGFLVSPQNSEDLKHFIDELFHKDKLRHELGIGLEQSVKTGFTLEAMIRGTVKIYTE